MGPEPGRYSSFVFICGSVFLGLNNLIIFDPLADPCDLKDFFLMAGE